MSARRESLSRLSGRIEAFEYRARLLSSLRRILEDGGFVEVETPCLVAAPAPEEHIEAPRTAEGLFLRSSPELQMKRLLAAGMRRIYQIGPCFRQGESGRLHRPEFTMLEWYMAGNGYLELMDFTKGMLRRLALELNGRTSFQFMGHEIDAASEWEVISVREAFERFAGEPADKCAEEGRFEIVLVEKVEPSLPKDRPVALKDYPAKFSSLSRMKSEDPSLAERWELYLGGVEIANAYGELTDPVEQRERFKEASAVRRESGMADYPEPEAFLDALDAGIPESSGCALGLDRLAMALYGADSIEAVSHPSDS